MLFWICNDLRTSNDLMAWWLCNVIFWLCNNLWTSNVWLMMVCKCMSFYNQSVCLLLFTMFSKCMHQGSQSFMLWKFKDLFDGIFTNLGIDMMDIHAIEGPIW